MIHGQGNIVIFVRYRNNLKRFCFESLYWNLGTFKRTTGPSEDAHAKGVGACLLVVGLPKASVRCRWRPTLFFCAGVHRNKPEYMDIENNHYPELLRAAYELLAYDTS